MSKLLKTATFDMTSNISRDRYEQLVNRPGVEIENTNDFFGTGRSPDGVEMLLTRVIDYWEPAPKPPVDEPYTMPIC
jgi:hypothetical protein